MFEVTAPLDQPPSPPTTTVCSNLPPTNIYGSIERNTIHSSR